MIGEYYFEKNSIIEKYIQLKLLTKDSSKKLNQN